MGTTLYYIIRSSKKHQFTHHYKWSKDTDGYMKKMSSSEMKSILKDNKPGKYSAGDSLYLVIPKKGNNYWMYRYSANGKRKEMSIGTVQFLPLSQARIVASEYRVNISAGEDPLVERKYVKTRVFKTVEDLFKDWDRDNKRRLEHPNIPERIYRNEVAPYLNDIQISDVKPIQIRDIIQKVADSGRKATANDTLMYLKQLFNHGIKLGIVNFNPASAFQCSDAGGIEAARERALTLEEIEVVYKVFRENNLSFVRPNYLATALLLVTCARKSELLEAPWHEFNLQKKVWELPAKRSKSKRAIAIPLSSQAIEWLKELKYLSCGSDYVFPSRRKSKQPFVGKDTLNTALNHLFGIDKSNRSKKPLVNYMGDIEHFTIHDLRRTARTHLASLKVVKDVAEFSLNHKIRGLAGIYDRYEYFEERTEALQQLSDLLAPMIND